MGNNSKEWVLYETLLRQSSISKHPKNVFDSAFHLKIVHIAALNSCHAKETWLHQTT